MKGYPCLYAALREMALCNNYAPMGEYPADVYHAKPNVEAAERAAKELARLNLTQDFVDGEMDETGWPVDIDRTPDREALHLILEAAFNYSL